MIQLTEGNLLKAPAEALVNTVNTEGVMGKGIALQFRQTFPAMFRAYVDACKAGAVRLGQMDVHDLGGLAEGPRWIINFPTKGHWRSRSRLADIDAGLVDLIATVRRLGLRSIAVPPLGCGHGGLDWAQVRPRIERAFAAVPEVTVLLYPPAGAPAAAEMPNRTERPQLTVARATLIALMDRYLGGLLDPFVSLLEVHKLMYFMHESGQELRLSYSQGLYGPYAQNLRQVLIRLEGHFLQGYGDGEDAPSKPIELLPGAVDAARDFLAGHVDVQQRMDRVAELIEGYEDPYGMELLSSVHWVMCHDSAARDEVSAAVKAVHAWSERKRKALKAEHLNAAWLRLRETRWDSASRSALR
jgi:O-acetyl-ADP-ribose deacetylase (regulator of RNase III)